MTTAITEDNSRQDDGPAMSEEEPFVSLGGASTSGTTTTTTSSSSQTSELDDPAQPSYSVTNERWKTLETIRELEAKVLLEEKRQRAMDNDDLDGPTIRSGTRSTALPKFRTKEAAAAALHQLEQQILEDKAGITGPRKYLECLEQSIVQEKGVPPQLASQILWQRQPHQKMPQPQLQQQQRRYHSKTPAPSTKTFTTNPRQATIVEDQTEQARVAVAQLESLPGVPSLVAAEARTALQLLESQTTPSAAITTHHGEAIPTRTAAEQALQQLETEATQKNSTNPIGNATTIPQQAVQALRELEMKAVHRGPPQISKSNPRTKMEQNLSQLESKFVTGDEPPQPSVPQLLRSSLHQLESKISNTDPTTTADPTTAATTTTTVRLALKQDQLRNTLTPLESNFDNTFTSGHPKQQPAGEERLRSSLHQLESKFSSHKVAAASPPAQYQQQTQVGAVAVGPPTANLGNYEQRLQAKLGAQLGTAGTATAVAGNKAEQTLQNMQAKVAVEGDAKVVVRLMDTQEGGIAASSVPEAAAARHNLRQIETKLLKTEIDQHPSKTSQRLPEQTIGTDAAAELEARLRAFDAEVTAKTPHDPGARQEEKVEERVESKLLHSDGSGNSGFSDLEETIASRMFAASRRGDGNVGAFANTPDDALHGHGPRSTLGVNQTSIDNPEQSIIEAGSTSRARVEGGSDKDFMSAPLHDIDAQEQGLAQAIEVNEEAIKAVPVSADEEKQQEERKQKFNTWVRRHATALCIVLLIIVVIVVAVLVTTQEKSSKDDLPAVAPTVSPTPAPTPYVVGLPDFTLEALQDPNSPQSLAYKWLSADPLLEDYPQERKVQRMALATLYYATNGDAWTLNNGWLSYDVDECFWFSKFNVTSGDYAFNPSPLIYHTTPDQLTGVPICDEEGNYLALVLSQNGLSGILPQEVLLLTNLELLALSDNQELSGSMASGIGLLTNMKELDFSSSKLTGSIPSEIGLMTNLEYLILREVPLSGNLPSEIGSIMSLKNIEIQKTHVTGTIPVEYYNLKNITFFGLNRNKLTGALPTEVGLLSNLVEIIRVDTNNLSGSIPTEIGLLTRLKTLNLKENALTGKIPSEIGNLRNLDDLWLEQNLLTSTVPAVLGTLPNITLFDIGDLLITGTVPLSIWLLPNMVISDISRNPFLEGSIPTEIGISNKYFMLIVYDMGPNWSTTIPTEIGMQTNLIWAWLYNGNIEGTIPTEVAQLSGLKDLGLYGNPLLTGTFPEAVGKLPLLENVTLMGTQLTGSLPDEICSINILQFDCLQMCGCECPCANQTYLVRKV